eukprot:9089015-Alexandrium_andersonii.AAC.1
MKRACARAVQCQQTRVLGACASSGSPDPCVSTPTCARRLRAALRAAPPCLGTALRALPPGL